MLPRHGGDWTGSSCGAKTTDAARWLYSTVTRALGALAKRSRIKEIDGREVDVAGLASGSFDRAEDCSLNGAENRRGGGCHHYSTECAVAAQRLSLCAAADDPKANAVFPASLPRGLRDQSSAKNGGESRIWDQ